MLLESGPARADRNWHLARAALFLAFAGWFGYDGFIGYPAKNREAADLVLHAEPYRGLYKYADLTDSPSKLQVDTLASRLQAQPPAQITREQVHAMLGQPRHSETIKTTTIEHYLGRFGRTTVTFEGDRATAVSQWLVWYKSEEEVRAQYYWMIVPLLPAAYFLWRLYKAVTLKVVVDDEGMVYAGQRIAFAEMVSLRDYNDKGWIDLYYKDGEQERKLRLDNEKVMRFDEIVDAICQQKGFENEVRDYAARKAREKAEEEAAQAAEDQAEPDEPEEQEPPR